MRFLNVTSWHSVKQEFHIFILRWRFCSIIKCNSSRQTRLWAAQTKFPFPRMVHIWQERSYKKERRDSGDAMMHRHGKFFTREVSMIQVSALSKLVLHSTWLSLLHIRTIHDKTSCKNPLGREAGEVLTCVSGGCLVSMNDQKTLPPKKTLQATSGKVSTTELLWKRLSNVSF